MAAPTEHLDQLTNHLEHCIDPTIKDQPWNAFILQNYRIKRNLDFVPKFLTIMFPG
jgi:hypothetical protein